MRDRPGFKKILFIISTSIAFVGIVGVYTTGSVNKVLATSSLIAALSGLAGMVSAAEVLMFRDREDNPSNDSGADDSPSVPTIPSWSFVRKDERSKYLGRWSGTGKDLKLPDLRNPGNHYENVRLELEESDDTIVGEFILTVVNEKKEINEQLDCKVDLVAVCGTHLLLRFGMRKRQYDHFGVLFVEIYSHPPKLRGFFLKKRLIGDKILGLAQFELTRS